MSKQKRKRSQKRSRRANLGELETSDWERGPDEMTFSEDDRAAQDKANVWIFGGAAALLLLVVLKKA
jgi:hypothetical protein